MYTHTSKMARFVSTSLSVLCCFILRLSAALELPPDGFWFNCGLDFCEFPTQYCRVIQGQRPLCQACTLDECYSLDTPLQCYTQCKELVGPDDVTTTHTTKGRLLGVKAEDKSTRTLLLENNERQWTVIYILSSAIIVVIILCIILIKVCNDKRILKRRIKAIQETTRWQTAGPQQTTPFNEGGNDDLHEITVNTAGANPNQNVFGQKAVVDNRPAEEEPLLPPPGASSKHPAPEGTVPYQPTRRSGNVECQFSPKLMDDGGSGMGRHMEQSTDSPSNESSLLPIITQPMDDHKASNLADYNLFDQHNMEQTTVTAIDSIARRHSTSSEETTTKNVFDTNTNQDKLSLPGDIEEQVQIRPRSSTGLNDVTPTAPPADSSSSLSSARSDATSGFSSPDSGHYGTRNSSPTGSVDLKNNSMQQPEVDVRQKVNS